MLKILLDTDTAGDDTIAIMMALKAKNASLEGITINCGNIDFDQEVENALYTVEAAGMSRKVPVYPGCDSLNELSESKPRQTVRPRIGPGRVRP